MTRALLDATTLIALGTVGELGILTTLDGPLAVLSPIADEVTTEPARTNLDRFLDHDAVERCETVPPDRIDQAQDLLGDTTPTGDVHLIAVVLAETAGDRPVGVVSDDRRVRPTARGLGATVSGTLGVIVHAVEQGMDPDDARDVLDRVDAHGLHLTGDLRARVADRIDDPAE